MTDCVNFKRFSVSIVLASMLMLPSLSYASGIRGRISGEAGPFKGARVHIYKSYEDLVAGKDYLVSGPAEGNGEYEMTLPDGEYYFAAQGTKERRNYYAYHGNNPISTRSENEWISFILNEAKPPVYRHGTVSLTGQITYKGQPVEKAWLSFYTTGQKSFKGAGFLNQQAEDNGTFSIAWLPPGKYVLIARKIEGDNTLRPLRKGELFCYYGRNPIEIREGKTLQVELSCYARGARSTFPESAPVKTNAPGIRGKVTDGNGKPVEHVYVIAFKSENNENPRPEAGGSVECFSLTDKDGNYFIPLESDENLYILARDRLGGNHTGKSMLGIYGGNPGKLVSFRKGQLLDGMNIVIGEQKERKKE